MPIQIDLPSPLDQELTPQEIALNLALGLYASDRVSLRQGAAIAGMSPAEFQKELGRRKIHMHYTLADLQEDIDSAKARAGSAE